MNIKKTLWITIVIVVLFSNLLVGVLLAIATAFYWLLERQHRQRLLASDIDTSNTARILRRIQELAQEQHQRQNAWASYIAGFAEGPSGSRRGQDYYLATVPLLECRDNKKHSPNASKFTGMPEENWLEWFGEHLRNDLQTATADATAANTHRVLIDKIAFETLLAEYALTTHGIDDAAEQISKVIRKVNGL